MARRIRKRRRRRTRKRYRGGGWWDTIKNTVKKGATTAKNRAGGLFGNFFKRGEKKDCSEDLRKLSAEEVYLKIEDKLGLIN